MAKKGKRKSGKAVDIGRREFVKKSARGIAGAGLAGVAATLVGGPGCATFGGKAERAIASGDEDLFEFIVVGSGAGGGPVACNLAKAGFRVLLLEAGTNYQGRNTDVPAFHPLSTEDPAMSWHFYVNHYGNPGRQARDSKLVQGKGILYPRAGTLGGCTAHNALITVYPDNSDWDNIAAITGDSSWASWGMRDFFERVERNRYTRRPLLFNTQRRGYDGWLQTEQTDPKFALKDRRLLEIALGAADHEGLKRELFQKIFLQGDNFGLDPNEWVYVLNKTDGLFNLPKATNNGHRNGTRELILRTLSEHPDKLVLRTGCLATRVLFDDVDRSRAVGVEYIEGEHLYGADLAAQGGRAAAGPPRRARVTQEVILAGGAFNSPQLLQLSGVGDPSDLQAAGIETRINLPGVGKNLQDRYEVGVVSQLDGEIEPLRALRFGGPDDPGLEDFDRHGAQSLYASNGALLAAFRRSSRWSGDPDLCIFALTGSFRGYYPGYSRDVIRKDRVTWAILKGHTRNTAGYVRARTPDPRDQPEINFRYFDEGSQGWNDDLEAVLEGVKWVRDMNDGFIASAAVQSEITPGPAYRTDEQLREFIKNESWGHHASCTNRMGHVNDPMSVVDSKFRVRGTRGLRVVDASVFPKIPGLFIVVPVYMIAEKASDEIIRDARG